ncbi:MAG: hypothetical protein IT378_26885 [Sandaracinaceae bacterium]|nr:hypothetical protein [Sandaracinaceae bacterium]
MSQTFMRAALTIVILLFGCGGPAPSPDAGSDASSRDAGIEWPALPECITYLPPGARIDHDFLRGSGAGGVSYRLWRCDAERSALGLTLGFRADAFELVIGGEVHRARTESIVYTVTHHNWDDSLVATTPTAILHWRTERDLVTFDPRYFVSATDLAGATILAETPVQ